MKIILIHGNKVEKGVGGDEESSTIGLLTTFGIITVCTQSQ